MDELKLNKNGETGCCPRFNPASWDEKIYEYKIKKLYMCYTTCPACAKAYGKNYVIIFGKI